MQYRLNINHDQNMKHDHFVRDQSFTDPERRPGGGRDRWPGHTLKITSSTGNKQLSSTLPLEMLDPLWNPKVQFSLILTVDPTVNMLRTMNPLYITLRTKKLTAFFFLSESVLTPFPL